MENSARSRFPLLSAGILGFTGVGLGALGAHRLEALLAERGMTHAWETGSRYHLFHAIALLGVSTLLRAAGPAEASRLNWAARLWTFGVLLFSGSLYWFSVGGPHPLVFVTPVGGIALLVGWAYVIAAVWAGRSTGGNQAR